MAKPGVSFEEVVAAAQELEKQGEKPTVERIKESLGGRGTLATINRFFKEWKNQQDGSSVGANQALDLTGEAMQESQHNQENSENNIPAQINESTGGNSINPQEIAPAAVLAQEESCSSASASQPVSPKHAPQPRVQSPFDESRETYQAEQLEGLDDNQLIIKIRRLETLIAKEQSRREAAEKMAEEAKDYADIIKEQIGQRVADLKHSMEVTINQFKAEARELKQNADNDLKFYREQLQKANVKIVSLLTGQAPEPVVQPNIEATSTKDSTGSVSE
jgi:hypothetical protein